MKYCIRGKEIYAPWKIDGECSILVNGDKFEAVKDSCEDGYEEIDLRKYKIFPGLVDIHIHGANGYDIMDAGYYSANEISKYIASLGVTSFLGATVTSPIDKTKKALANIRECMKHGLKGARLMGAHLEGPYISKEYKGAHPYEHIKDIDLNEIDDLLVESGNTVKVITIAPEKENALSAIKLLAGKGIKVALGHTNATYSESIRAIEAGASIAVHLFNGMRGLHHREPGLVGAALTDDRISVELICDGIHLDVPVIQIVLKCKNTENVLLITDSIMATGLSDGTYQLGESLITVKKGISKLENGTLAGSTLKLIDAVKNMVRMAGVKFEHALAMATINPAKAIGLGSIIGSIEKGKKADIIAVDEDLKPVFVMVDGIIIF